MPRVVTMCSPPKRKRAARYVIITCVLRVLQAVTVSAQRTGVLWEWRWGGRGGGEGWAGRSGGWGGRGVGEHVARDFLAATITNQPTD